MSKTIIKPSKEDIQKINEEIKKATTTVIIFHNFQMVEVKGMITADDFREVTRIIETAESFLALESRALEFKNK